MITKKAKNTVVITFKEDYGVHKSGNAEMARFRKDQVTYAHKSIAEKLKKAGAKITVSPYKYEDAVEKAKENKAKEIAAQKKAEALS